MDIELDLQLLTEAPASPDQPPFWFLFRDGALLVCEDPAMPPLPEHDDPLYLGLPRDEGLFIGRLFGRPCFAVSLEPDAPAPEGYYPEPLRRLTGRLEEHYFVMAGRASQVLTWLQNHRFCSRCGHPTRAHERDLAMVCAQCGYSQYPRITPCVIMLVTRGDQALLARSPRFPEGFYSCLAGFMEPGETAEQAVRREVMEETAVEIRDLRYYGSQSWPFPHSLMLGFRAEHRGGEIHVDGEEIVDAQWWRVGELPRIPPQGSIARALIDDWVGGVARERTGE